MLKPSVVLLALATVAGCADQPIAPESPATRAAVLANTREPFGGTLTNPCNGDVITVTGSLHETFTITTDNAGGIRVSSHANPASVKGVGTSGDAYVFSGATNSTQHIKAGSAETESFVNIFKVVGPGKDNNFSVRETVHITINANGEPSTVRSGIELTCK